MLLDGDDPGTALAVCDRLREALRNHALEFGDDPLILSASGGIARFVPGDTGTSDVIRRADCTGPSARAVIARWCTTAERGAPGRPCGAIGRIAFAISCCPS